MRNRTDAEAIVETAAPAGDARREHVEGADEGSRAPVEAPARHHRLRTLLIALAAIIVLGAGFVYGSYRFRDQPEAKSVDAAVDAFRTDTTPVVPGSFAQPAPGVYEAKGSGDESISAPPMAQEDGATMPITVRLLDQGCWRWRIDYNTAHWHEYDFCPDGEGLILTHQQNFQSWDLGVDEITNLSTTTCDPPAAILVSGAVEGDTVQHSCTAVNTAAEGESVSSGPSTTEGFETLTIDGTEVRTVHQHRTLTMTGTQRGSLEEDWWLEAETGLPIKVSRDYDLTTESIIGEIRYLEQGSWELGSLTPRT